MAIKEIKLNAQNFDTMKKFAMVQGDSARVLRCYVDVDLSTVTEARIYIKKADGTEIYNDCTVTNQYIDAPLTTQALAVVGDQVAQLHLKDGGGYITTYKFILQVLKSYVSGSAIESSNEFTALENALTEVEEFGADNLVYDNEESGLEATNIQDAIDELASSPSGVYVGDEPPVKATTWIDTSEDAGGGTFVDLYKMEVNKVPIEGLGNKTVEGAINEVTPRKNFNIQGNDINEFFANLSYALLGLDDRRTTTIQGSWVDHSYFTGIAMKNGGYILCQVYLGNNLTYYMDYSQGAYRKVYQVSTTQII